MFLPHEDILSILNFKPLIQLKKIMFPSVEIIFILSSILFFSWLQKLALFFSGGLITEM